MRAAIGPAGEGQKAPAEIPAPVVVRIQLDGLVEVRQRIDKAARPAQELSAVEVENCPGWLQADEIVQDAGPDREVAPLDVVGLAVLVLCPEHAGQPFERERGLGVVPAQKFL